MKTQKEPWRKKTYIKVTLLLKNRMFLELQSPIGGKKYTTIVQQNTGISKLDEIKKLKKSIEELEFVKDSQ
jgi:transposase